MHKSLRVASKIYSEEYIVKFVDRSGEFVKHRTQSYFFASKGRHEEAAKNAMRDFNLRDSDIISVIYQ